MSEHITAVTDASFEAEVVKSDLPVLVDFWAEWCGPCRALAPTLDAIAAAYHNKLKVVKVNVDQSTGIPAQYGIRSIPTLILFKGGQVEATKVGSQTQAQLTTFLDQYL